MEAPLGRQGEPPLLSRKSGSVYPDYSMICCSVTPLPGPRCRSFPDSRISLFEPASENEVRAPGAPRDLSGSGTVNPAYGHRRG